MPIILDGTGTISGLVAGGLPDATVTAADLATGAVNAQALTLFNASGSAPVFACRAWVNFNGTGTVAIRASGNVSSITRTGTGLFTINLSTAMPDANYAVAGTAQRPAPNLDNIMVINGSAAYDQITTTAVNIRTMDSAATLQDSLYVGFTVHR